MNTRTFALSLVGVWLLCELANRLTGVPHAPVIGGVIAAAIYGHQVTVARLTGGRGFPRPGKHRPHA